MPQNLPKSNRWFANLLCALQALTHSLVCLSEKSVQRRRRRIEFPFNLTALRTPAKNWYKTLWPGPQSFVMASASLLIGSASH